MACPSDTWDPQQYNRFAAEREQPFWDLAALVGPFPHQPAVVDLGCGDGRLTALLAERLGAASMIGIDNSEAMLAGAEAHASGEVSFRRGDIASWCEPDAYDVVFANASLQWIPDHATVLERWRRSVRPGGWLAVQVPRNWDHASHLVAAEVASEFLDDPPADPVAANVLPPEDYAQLLHDLGSDTQHVRLQVYGHVVDSPRDLVEWTKGTSLTRFKPHLTGDRWDDFVAAYTERLVATLGDRSPYFYPFKRILFAARF